MGEARDSLRVAFVAGSLRKGGAEKQLWYQASALRRLGVGVRVYTLTRGEHYEESLRRSGIEPEWIGRGTRPPARLLTLVSQLRRFRPHVVQATHAFVNLYAAVAARVFGAMSVGAVRGSLRRCREANGAWARWLLSSPTALVTNSRRTAEELQASGLLDPARIYVLDNAVDAGIETSTHEARVEPISRVIFVGSLAKVKRADVFLKALATARLSQPGLRGRIIGEGPERAKLTELAGRLGLLPGGVEFLGERDDVPALLRQADMLVLTSDDEGVPNVVLEAMAAGLPVVATPAGDTPDIVEDGVTGLIAPFGDASAIAERIVTLSTSPQWCRQLGHAGRERVALRYRVDGLAERLVDIYQAIAARKGSPRDASVDARQR